jgi:hypothetical protein
MTINPDLQRKVSSARRIAMHSSTKERTGISAPVDGLVNSLLGEDGGGRGC